MFFVFTSLFLRASGDSYRGFLRFSRVLYRVFKVLYGFQKSFEGFCELHVFFFDVGPYKIAGLSFSKTIGASGCGKSKFWDPLLGLFGKTVSSRHTEAAFHQLCGSLVAAMAKCFFLRSK